MNLKNKNFYLKDTVSKNSLRDVLKNTFKYIKNEIIDMLIRTAEDELDSADSSRVEYKFLFNEVKNKTIVIYFKRVLIIFKKGK